MSVYINRLRPLHHDAETRAFSRKRAEQIGTEEYREHFIAWMRQRYYDEATVARELNRLDAIVANRREAMELDSR